MTTAIVWLRRDLRLHDHPALMTALGEHDRVVPLFVVDPVLLGGRFRSPGRTAWMLDALRSLDGDLREAGGRLVVRQGRPEQVLPQVAAEVDARAVHCSAEATGFARARDDRVAAALGAVPLVRHPGVYVADLAEVPRHEVFSAFARVWRAQGRRAVLPAPAAVRVPDGVASAPIPAPEELGFERLPSLDDRPPASEREALRAAQAWIRDGLAGYAEERGVLAQDTSRLSVHLRFGTLSARWLEDRVLAAGGRGGRRFRDELAWRDFLAAVLLHHPEASRVELQERYRTLRWSDDPEALQAWKEGRTGYPVVDAGMRQLLATGWMHNRARMVVASFLTKDLHLDWRLGEAHFMAHLLDGDVPSNNGGWQWAASTGTDAVPYVRILNPVRQQERFDADGAYVRRWVPELARVPDETLSRPWTMTDAQQRDAGCVIGRDYPAPIVDHDVERRRALERYAAAA